MTKNILMLALASFGGVAQAQAVDAYYASLNLGIGFKNKLPESGSSLSNVRFLLDAAYKASVDASKKTNLKNKVGFSGDLRFGRDFQLGQSCGFMGLFAGIGFGGGSTSANVDTTITKDSKANPFKYNFKMAQKLYIPLGMRLGYSISGTKIFLSLGYAPQKVEFSGTLNGTKTSASKMTGSFLVGLGFATPIAQNAYLGLSAETFFGKIKAPAKFTTAARASVESFDNTLLATFDSNAKKASSYVQTRIMVSFTYAVPSSR